MPLTVSAKNPSYASVSRFQKYSCFRVTLGNCFYLRKIEALLKTSRTSTKFVLRCEIWYHLYNLKNVKNTHGRVLILVKWQA